MSQRKAWFILIPAFSLLLLILLFIPGLGEDFFAIDDGGLFNQGFLRNPWTWQSFKILVTPGYLPDYYPLRDLSVWIDWSFASNLLVDTSIAKIHNLIILIGIAILTFWILYRLTKHKLFSMMWACAWLLHPFHLESLHWISARKDLLCWFFMLLSSSFIIRAFDTQKTEKKFVILACLSFVLSLLCKAVFLVMPFVFVAWILLVSYVNKIKIPRALVSGGVVACLLSLFFVAVNYWNYTQNNYMKMTEENSIRILSVMAALGRNLLGVLLPTYNGVDVEPWGGWYRFNQGFIPLGILGVVLFLWWGMLAVRRKNVSALLLWSIIAAILVMTPGFNPNHRNFYSIRYFEPVFFVLFLWGAIFVSRMRFGMHIACIVLVVFASASTWDASHWQSNLAIFKKSYLISPEDPSLRGMLLTEYYNVSSWGKLSAEDQVDHVNLYKKTLKDCIETERVDGRCLSFMAHIKDFAEGMKVAPEDEAALLRKTLDKVVAIKGQVFSEVAKSQIAWSIFHFNLYNGFFDQESLRVYFKAHPFMTDDFTRVKYLIFQCLDVDPAHSQALYNEWLSKGIMRSAEASDFIASLKHESLRKTAQNCLKTRN